MKASIPSATVARLPRYLQCLSDMAAEATQCSSDQIAAGAGVTAAQVRKDLSYLGSHGTRGVGYDIDELMAQIRRVLGMTRTHRVAIVGAGNLGAAMTNYRGFENWGFEIAALIDIDGEKLGTLVNGLFVEPLSALQGIVDDRQVTIGIIATPPTAAQDVANRLTRAGIKSILNLAPVVLTTPEDVSVRRVDLSTELGILAYHLAHV